MELSCPSPPRAGDDARPIIARVGPKRVRRIIKGVLVLSLFIGVGLACAMRGAVFVPVVLAMYAVCGVLDVLRNTRRDLFTIEKYFLGNGIGTWLLSPFNLLMDALALPCRNRGVYALGDMPRPIQDEINDLIRSAHDSNVIERLEGRIGGGRSMIFFKWYGRDLENSIEIPAFHKPYRYIRTIGVSVFNRRKSSSWHFGPLRATFRVLYNLRPSEDDGAWIQVGRHVHRWNEGPLFIFDDTLIHQSCNQTDAVRYCMFVDIVRPSGCPSVIRAVVTGLRILLLPVRFAFYRRWLEIR